MNVSRKTWKRVLEHCRHFDVEEGEADEYMYSVRSSTGTVTVWTQRGWRDGYFVASFVPVQDLWNNAKKKRFDVSALPTTTAPLPWSKERADVLLREIVALVEASRESKK
jgi:hypothetical protein